MYQLKGSIFIKGVHMYQLKGVHIYQGGPYVSAK